MKKKRVNKIWDILLILIIAAIIIPIMIYVKPSMTGYTVFESQPDSTTGKDTYIRENSGTNYGTQTTLGIGKIVSGLEYRSLLYFNLSSIPSTDTIVYSKLQVYSETTSGLSNITIKAYRLTSNWNETSSNWNNRDDSTAWLSAGGDYDLTEIDSLEFSNQSGFYYNFTITNAVRGWINGSYNNYGIILISSNANSGNYTYLSSSDSITSSQRPKLIIDHSENALPIINSISQNSSLQNPMLIGELLTFTVNWTDLESDTAQVFVCNSSNIVNLTGCSDRTFCNTSMESSGVSSCTYTIQSSDNRTTPFYTSVCQSDNCSTINASYFYVNHKPTALVLQPNGGEIINQSQGNYTIQFNATDNDSDLLSADIYYGTTSGAMTNLITSNLNLTENCVNPDSNTSTTDTCTYLWNSTEIYGTYYLTINLNDSYATSNDSSNSNFYVRSLIDNTPPNITSQWIDSDIYSGKNIQIYANVSEPNINTVWTSINTSPQTNLTLTNTTLTTYNVSWKAVSVGNYQFKVYANDSVGNLNNTMPWQIFNIRKPLATTQNELIPSSALPYHTIKVTAQLNATEPLRDVYAYLNVPSNFTFLLDYSQNSLMGNFSENQTKTATWFVSLPITEDTYLLNITYTDYYSNQWNSSNTQIQVTSAIGGGYFISVSGYPEVETNNNYFVEAYFTQSGTNTNADSVLVSIYDSTDALIVGPVSMNNPANGAYNYTYSVPAAPNEGQWKTLINATKSSTSYYAVEYWKVVGGPFDVRNITIINSSIDNLNISFIAENTGGANKDLTIVWNLTKIETGTVLDSESETFMVPSNSNKTWHINPVTTYVGQVKIIIIGYYSGTEKAGAYKTFSTTGSNISNESPGAGSGGGGGGGATISKQNETKSANKNYTNKKNKEKPNQTIYEKKSPKNKSNEKTEFPSLKTIYFFLFSTWFFILLLIIALIIIIYILYKKVTILNYFKTKNQQKITSKPNSPKRKYFEEKIEKIKEKLN